MTHGYSAEAVAKLHGRCWRNPRTPLKNGVHCLEYDKFAGYVNDKGYARLWLDKKSRYAHRTALEIHEGRRLTVDELALHECDNPLCCEPLHLRVATILENNADRDAKGRNGKGYAKKRSFVSRQTAERIILAMCVERHWDETMASRFGCSADTIRHIRKGRSWGWLWKELAPEIERRREQKAVAAM